MDRIGLIAGGGRLPIIFAQEARKRGAKVVGFAIKEMASPEFDSACDRVHWVSIGEFKKCLLLFIVERIRKVAMLGKVDKTIIYSDIKRDYEAASLLKSVKDKNDYTLLDRVTHELSKRGIEVINSTDYLADLLPQKGVLTKRVPTKEEGEDVAFGMKMAKDLARLDIGQTIVVKSKAIVCVEAMEGTDRTIKRAKELCGGGFTVIKVSRPQQDMRWDVPVVGPETLSLIAEHKGKALAIEEKRMFLVDKERCAKIADDNGISIVVM
ncbi:MAG: UDP-2,3-diacylglucosamine diphosphatase LpxI [Candidatus Omnitrophota bacterium]